MAQRKRKGNLMIRVFLFFFSFFRGGCVGLTELLASGRGDTQAWGVYGIDGLAFFSLICCTRVFIFGGLAQRHWLDMRTVGTRYSTSFAMELIHMAHI